MSSTNVCVTVEDDGAGVAPAVREKILQPFFTTKTQGTGLGLAIVARRVNEFRGQLGWKVRARWKRQRVSSFDSVEAKREIGSSEAVPSEKRKV